MNRLVVGVIGHVDHGKTALVRALTGEDTDRLIEEKKRGISIALGFAHLSQGDTDVDLIDMPGHERFVRTMISGATGIDAVLLVVAANEGIKPQTIEHIDIAGLLGLKRAVVAVTKADLVSEDDAALVGEEAVELLTRAGLQCAATLFTSIPPIHPPSSSHPHSSSQRKLGSQESRAPASPETPASAAVTNEGRAIDDLRRALVELAKDQPPRPTNGLAFLPIDRAFAIAGHGPVVTGTLRGAPITEGDTLELIPLGRKVRVRAVQVHGAKVNAARPGQRAALNLRDVDVGELERGMALAAPDSLAQSDWLTISIRSVAGAPPLKNGKRLRALIGTAEVEVRLRLLDRDILAPGESGFAQLRCATPVAAPPGEHVILRIASPARTVAGGRLLEPETQRRKRKKPATLARLAALATLPSPALIAAEIAQAGALGVSFRALSRLSGLDVAHVSSLLHDAPVEVTSAGFVVGRELFEKMLTRIPALIAPHATGLSQDRLLTTLTKLGEPASAEVGGEALARLMASGAVAKRGSQFIIPRPDEDRARARGEAELAARIAETLRGAGLAPPRPDEIVTDAKSRGAVDRLLRDGTLIRAVDRDKRKEIFFHHDAIDLACRTLAPLLEEGTGLGAGEIAAALGISRKYCMPLLDHLDGIRFTRRIDDRRVRGTGGPADTPSSS